MLGDKMLGYARELVAAAGDEIDVVSQLADPALIRAIDDYFGTPGPDAETQARWARDIFWELFINVNNLAETRERALADAAEWRTHLDGLVDARKAAIAADEDVPDDVLTRLLRFQDEGEPNFYDISIRHNILGNIVGWIPTVSNSMARAVNVLLDREDELEGAQAAARAGDRDLVARYVWEALRFSPQNFALLRLVEEDQVDRCRHRSRDDRQGGLDGLRRDALGDARRARAPGSRGLQGRPPVQRLHALRPRAAHVLRPADRQEPAAGDDDGAARRADDQARRQAQVGRPVPVEHGRPLRRRLTRHHTATVRPRSRSRWSLVTSASPCSTAVA